MKDMERLSMKLELEVRSSQILGSNELLAQCM